MSETASPVSPTFFIPSGEAGLCVNCDAVFWIRRRLCPACGSNNWWPISKFIEKQVKEERNEG